MERGEADDAVHPIEDSRGIAVEVSPRELRPGRDRAEGLVMMRVRLHRLVAPEMPEDRFSLGPLETPKQYGPNFSAGFCLGGKSLLRQVFVSHGHRAGRGEAHSKKRE